MQANNTVKTAIVTTEVNQRGTEEHLADKAEYKRESSCSIQWWFAENIISFKLRLQRKTKEEYVQLRQMTNQTGNISTVDGSFKYFFIKTHHSS